MRALVVDLIAQSRNWSLPPDGERAIRSATPAGWEVRVVRAPSVSDGDGGAAPSDEVVAAIADAEVYLGFGMSRALFLHARALRWIHSAAAGVQSALFPELVTSDVLLTNSAGIHAVPIAEHVLAGVLHLTRQLDTALDLQRRGVWDKAPFVAEDSPIRELGESRALIVGAGGLGREIARRLAAFGVRCTGIRRRPALGTPDGFARIVGPDQLDAELPEADILVLSAPSTPDTQALIGAERLDRLPRGAIVVNVSRGVLLDEGALASRIAQGRLRGAVLDVFEREPLVPDSPLWQLSQVVLTPHISAVSPRRFWARQIELCLENWHRYRVGNPLRNLVDKSAGY